MTAFPGHHCHAIGCEVFVPAVWFMCSFHWLRLPRRLRDAVWAAYQPGQPVTLDLSPEWLKAAQEAVRWVAEREGRRPATLELPEEDAGG